MAAHNNQVFDLIIPPRMGPCLDFARHLILGAAGKALNQVIPSCSQMAIKIPHKIQTVTTSLLFKFIYSAVGV